MNQAKPLSFKPEEEASAAMCHSVLTFVVTNFCTFAIMRLGIPRSHLSHPISTNFTMYIARDQFLWVKCD